MKFEEINGIQTGAGLKLVIYGQEGVGKTSLAANFPGAVFIDCEGSTTTMNVRRLPRPTSWAMLCEELNYVLETHAEKGYETVIIDTFDWAERLALDELCKEHNVQGIEGFNYGKGWQFEAEKIGRFLDFTDKLTSIGINIALLCHAISRKTTLPEEMEEYDHWELKLGSKTTNKIAPLLKEWSDITLFLAFRTNIAAVDDSGKKHKATSVQRMMYASKTAWWDAKNRFGLPDSMPLEYKQIEHIFGKSKLENPVQSVVQKAEAAEIPTEKEPEDFLSDYVDITPEYSETKPKYERVAGIPDALADLMQAAEITAKEVETACSDIKGYMPSGMPLQNYPQDFVQGCLIGAWNQVKNIIINEVRKGK